jgi:hypothetical protein
MLRTYLFEAACILLCQRKHLHLLPAGHEMVCVLAICVFSWWTLMTLWLGRSKCKWAGPAIALVFTARRPHDHTYCTRKLGQNRR